MKYKVLETRAQFLRDKFFEYSFKGYDLDIQILDLISEPIELDFIAKNHNYDDGNEILIHIINNPNCDLSTAKRIFFRADVESFLKNNKNSEDNQLINSIIKNCENKFYINENFYYNPIDDSDVLDFDVDKAKQIFPSILFGQPKGKKLEPHFADKFYKRNLSTLKENVEIKKKRDCFYVATKDFMFEYSLPKNFEIIETIDIERFISEYKFPESLPENFDISEKQLKKVIIKPELVISNKDFIITFFLFNSESLLLKDALTNVATIMRNEFVYIQAFIEIKGVEENFERIKRIKHNENWLALSKGMQIKIANIENEKYFKFLLLEKNGLLFYFTIISDSIEYLNNENIQSSIIEHININEKYS